MPPENQEGIVDSAEIVINNQVCCGLRDEP
jgi:hypothetical protein